MVLIQNGPYPNGPFSRKTHFEKRIFLFNKQKYGVPFF